MKSATSLYLDFVRFLAAIFVFSEHLRQHAKGHFSAFWNHHLLYASQTAVIVFFVLSGYVIAYVLATRERTAEDFAASRFARLYSVVIPALLLIALTNYLVPHIYFATESEGDNSPFSYLATALFANRFWFVTRLEPHAAGVFWSLSFEASYYVAIGLCLFLNGWKRFFTVAGLVALVGPTIVLFAPIWFLGFWTYHAAERTTLQKGIAASLWVVSIAGLCFCPLVEEMVRIPARFLRVPDKDFGMLISAYAAAGCFAVNLFAFNSLADSLANILQPLKGMIRQLGSMTFSLYLFHSPLLVLLVAYRAKIPSYLIMPWLIIGTFAVVAVLGYLCEQSKEAYRLLFHQLCRRTGLAYARDVAGN
jgi:peptidoglycan/LPS O-acetylase OafA/YrhL